MGAHVRGGSPRENPTVALSSTDGSRERGSECGKLDTRVWGLYQVEEQWKAPWGQRPAMRGGPLGL